MCDAQIEPLVCEIRDLYRRQCALADALRGLPSECSTHDATDNAPERGLLPELNRFGKTDRHAAYRTMINEPAIKRRLEFAKWCNWSITFGVCFYLLLSLDSWLIAATAGVLLSGGLWLAEQRFWLRPLLQDNLRKQLIERGVPICRRCGYDLRGLENRPCPECGCHEPSPMSTHDSSIANAERPLEE